MKPDNKFKIDSHPLCALHSVTVEIYLTAECCMEWESHVGPFPCII